MVILKALLVSAYSYACIDTSFIKEYAYLMTNKWKTFVELIVLAIVSFLALHFLGIYIHSNNKSDIMLHDFNIASIVAPIVFFAIAIFAAIFG